MADRLPSADVCERVLRAALSAGDMRGVQAALTLLAVQDGPRAQEMVDVLRLGLDLAEDRRMPDRTVRRVPTAQDRCTIVQRLGPDINP